MKHSGKSVQTDRVTVQGGWRPNLFGTYPKHKMQYKPPLPQFIKTNKKIKREEYDIKQKYKKEDRFKRFFKAKYFENHIDEEFERP